MHFKIRGSQFIFWRPRLKIEGWVGFGLRRFNPVVYGGMDWQLNVGFVTVRHWRR